MVGFFDFVGLKFRIAGLIGVVPGWLGESDEPIGLRFVEARDRFIEAFAGAAGEIDESFDVAALHDGEECVGRGEEIHFFAEADAVDVLGADGEMSVDVYDGIAGFFDFGGVSVKHALGTEVGEVELHFAGAFRGFELRRGGGDG